MCPSACVLVDADLEQQDAGEVTGVGGFFALKIHCFWVTAESWRLSTGEYFLFSAEIQKEPVNVDF